MRNTALRAEHEALGARMVPFAGWTMPVQYGSVLEEVERVRTAAGLFDLGHMGRLHVDGPQAEAYLQRVQTNDAQKIAAGGIRYALLLDEQGLTQDDILLYREPDDDGFFVVVNAANTDHDLAILAAERQGFEARLTDQTATLGMFAIQGPRSVAITQRLCAADVGAMKYYSWLRTDVAGVPAAISRTGYTGEDGFEVYADQQHVPALWNAFLETGRDDGLRPCGLAARDILRLEAGMALFGHEIDRSTNPLEAGLSWAVKWTHDFVGRAALERVRDQGGTGRRLVGLISDSKRVPRQGYEVWAQGGVVGTVCSGAASPTLGKSIATAYVGDEHAAPGTAIEFAVRDRREPATVVELPFYRRPR